jgi:hypothetical protein
LVDEESVVWRGSYSPASKNSKGTTLSHINRKSNIAHRTSYIVHCTSSIVHLHMFSFIPAMLSEILITTFYGAIFVYCERKVFKN